MCPHQIFQHHASQYLYMLVYSIPYTFAMSSNCCLGDKCIQTLGCWQIMVASLLLFALLSHFFFYTQFSHSRFADMIFSLSLFSLPPRQALAVSMPVGSRRLHAGELSGTGKLRWARAGTLSRPARPHPAGLNMELLSPIIAVGVNALSNTWPPRRECRRGKKHETKQEIHKPGTQRNRFVFSLASVMINISVHHIYWVPDGLLRSQRVYNYSNGVFWRGPVPCSGPGKGLGIAVFFSGVCHCAFLCASLDHPRRWEELIYMLLSPRRERETFPAREFHFRHRASAHASFSPRLASFRTEGGLLLPRTPRRWRLLSSQLTGRPNSTLL